MEVPNGSQGVDSLHRSTLTSQCDESIYSHNMGRQHILNNSALDIASRDEKPLQDPNIVDWEGPDDPKNPLNWASSKKLAALTIVSLVTMIS